MKILSRVSLFVLLNNLAVAQDWNFSGSIENTLWLADGTPPAFLELKKGYLVDPRLSLSVDYQPDPRFSFHATLRADRGFDPGTHPDGQARLDEFIALYRPHGNNLLNIQIGKSPTVVGNWVPTHDYYENPFILAPLPYSAINGVNVNNPAANSPEAIEINNNLRGSSIHNNKENWSSIIWGPAYSNGVSVFGNTETLDYAFEMKNSSLGAQPSEWDFGDGDFKTPTVSTRIGYRPDASLAFGLSASYGHYLNTDASDILDAGLERSDFTQTLVGLDIRWSHRDWLLSGEAFHTTYNTLHEDFHTLSYYLQTRYKVAPGIWLAGRFGQTLSNEVSIPSGGEVPWSPDLIRGELALGWRITPDVLFKTQYAYTLVTTDFSEPSQNLMAVSIGWRF
ncbi:hypothetical protein [Rubritalea sp.]|uniref:hypothetical protein n=1 Tax=Rubritalea sp. TaxID=2109375 RepID=UPI003EF523A9